jgi:hypothetical protein
MQHATARSSTQLGKVYKFVEHQDYTILTNMVGTSFSKDFLRIEPNGEITVVCSHKHTGYAWDGCSPKANWLDITWGTPDGKLDWATEKPKTYYASLVHDVLYQYKQQHGLRRYQCDDVFYNLLKQAQFKPAKIYYLAVRLLGGVFGDWKGKDRWW